MRARAIALVAALVAAAATAGLEYVPVSGNGRRLLLHGHSRVWAVEPKR